jgi:hypothetical protein
MLRGDQSLSGQGIAAIWADPEMMRRAANPATPLLTLHWTFSANGACVVVTDSEPGGFAPLPRQRRWASAGFGWCGVLLRQPSGALLRRHS